VPCAPFDCAQDRLRDALLTCAPFDCAQDRLRDALLNPEERCKAPRHEGRKAPQGRGNSSPPLDPQLPAAGCQL
jgi:hypothetical protein